MLYYLSIILLCLSAFIPSLYLSIYALMISVLLSNKNCIIVGKPTIILLIILFTGLLSSILRFNDFFPLYNFFRDFFYYIQPIIFLYLGFTLGGKINESEYRSLLIIIFVAIFFVSVYSSFNMLLNIKTILSSDLSDERYGNTLAPIGIALLFYSKINNFNLIKNKYLFYLSNLILLVNIFLSFSRTTIISFFLIYIIFFIHKYKLHKATFSICLFTIMFTLFGSSIIPIKPNEQEILNFTDKIKNSLSEIIIKENFNDDEIYNNWRSYESQLGLNNFKDGSIKELFIGKGLGAVVHTPSYVFSNKNQLDKLPIFHNSYINILLKTGILGFILYLAFLKEMCLFNTKTNSIETLIIQYCGYYILLSSLVIHGIYKTNVNIYPLILIGMSIGVYRSKLYNNYNSNRTRIVPN